MADPVGPSDVESNEGSKASSSGRRPEKPTEEVKSFEEMISLLPLATEVEMNKALGGDFNKAEKYWETRPWFLASVQTFLGVQDTERVIDLTCGQGLACLQFSFLNNAKSVVGIEISQQRLAAAKLNHAEYKAIIGRMTRKVAEVELICADWHDIALSEKVYSGSVFFATANTTKSSLASLEELLQNSNPGTRLLTSTCVFDFVTKGTTYDQYQVIKIEQDLTETGVTSFDAGTHAGRAKATPASSTDKRKVATHAYRDKDDYEPKANLVALEQHTPNTTKQSQFLTFYLYTKKRLDGDKVPLQNIDWKALSYRGFASISVGVVFMTMSVEWTKKSPTTTKTKFVTLRFDYPFDNRCKYTTILPLREIFATKEECDVHTKDLNAWRLTPPHPIFAGLSTHIPFDMEYIVQNILPPNFVKTLNIKPSDIIYAGQTGFRSDFGKFDVVTDVTASSYLSSRNQDFYIPVLFGGYANESLNECLPDDSTDSMEWLKSGFENMLSCPVYKTGPTMTQTLSTTMGIDELETYFSTPVNERNSVLSVPHIPLENHSKRYELSGPSGLAASDLRQATHLNQYGIPDYSKNVELVAQGSFQTFQCHSDGATVWICPAQGYKMCFMLLGPKKGDYDSIADPAIKFMTDKMVGRVVAFELGPWQTFAYSSHIPFAYYAMTDCLSYYGRVIPTSGITRAVHFGQEPWTLCCTAQGYTLDQVMAIAFCGSGMLVWDLWFSKVTRPWRFNHKGHGIIRDFCHLVQNFQGKSGLKTNAWAQSWSILRSQCVLLGSEIPAELTQTVFGVMFITQDHHWVLPVLHQMTLNDSFIPTIYNVLDGDAFRRLDVGYKSEADWLDYKSKNNVPLDLQFKFDAFYKKYLIESPKAVIKVFDKQIMVLAYTKLPAWTVVHEMTGRITTDDKCRFVNNKPNPPGKCFPLRVIRTKGQKPKTVWLDCTNTGGISLFIRTTRDPNCEVICASVNNRAVLVLVTLRLVLRGEELTIAEPRNGNVGFKEYDRPQTVLNFLLEAEVDEGVGSPQERSPEDANEGVGVNDEEQQGSPEQVNPPGHSMTPPPPTTPGSPGRRSLSPASNPSPPRTRKASKKRVVSSPESPQPLPTGSPYEHDPESVPKFKRPYFYVGTDRIDRVWYTVPNNRTHELLKTASAAKLKLLREVNVGRHYRNLDHYDAINETLSGMYGLIFNDRTCMVCGHLGNKINKVKKPFHTFLRRGGYEKHWKRYHYELKTCPICEETFLSGLQLRAHLESMAAHPNERHQNHTRVTGQIPGLRKWKKDDIRNKPYVNRQNEEEEEDSEDEGSEDFEESEEEVAKQPKKKGRRE